METNIVYDTTKTIKALGYNRNSIQDDSIIPDGVNFECTGNFLLISNRAIPKSTKVYIEMTITSQPSNKDIRHIPLMVGVHKEPSFGIINSDCCFGAIYYTKNNYYTDTVNYNYLAYRIIDKLYGGAIESSFTNQIKARVPIKKTVIGIGVDMLLNTITIYSDGNEFYSFSPKYFNMNTDPADFFFAIYCAESTETVSGKINFGKYGTTHLPNGYSSFYQQYYGKKDTNFSLPCFITVGQRNADNAYDFDAIAGSLYIENDLAPVNANRRDLELIASKPDTMTYYSDLNHTDINRHAFQFSPNNEEWAYINFPMDKYKQLYFEFHCANASLIDNYLGIPISIGLTKDITDLTQASFKLDLFHPNVGGYSITTRQSGFEFSQGNYNITSPSTPIQPNSIGVIIDLYTNSISLYTEGLLFMTVTSELIDFSKPDEPVWVFFEPCSKAFKGTGHVICNFGTKNVEDHSYHDNNFKFEYLRDNDTVYDLWYYYNYTIKESYYNSSIDRDCSIPCTIKVISDKLNYSKIIYASITVAEEKIANEWGPGLNKLWATYNKVSKAKERNNVPDKSIFDLQKMIEADKENNSR